MPYNAPRTGKLGRGGEEQGAGMTAMGGGTAAETGARLVITADVRYLVVIRQFVQTAGRGLGASQRVIDDLVQAADELCANTILYGYDGQAGEIEVIVRREGDGLAVALRDRAPVFDPASVREPDLDAPLEERAVGGLGIFLSRKLTDELRHRARAAGGNELVLVKHALSDATETPS
jgi:serine/threonine-protein kinase RsbW